MMRYFMARLSGYDPDDAGFERQEDMEDLLPAVKSKLFLEHVLESIFGIPPHANIPSSFFELESFSYDHFRVAFSTFFGADQQGRHLYH
ncbi:GL12879 [Drosophila persimilis]|uniref:GL12879 n=1 Tax=Drosophila persimilis TaxID=7234 RepID=B4GVA3_DROPE|nr:GL12879 [Drosophila persimilis]